MYKPLIRVFLMFILLVGYLSYSLLTLKPQPYSEIENLLPNTHVALQGEPEKVRYYGDEVRFYLNGTQIRVQGLKVIQNRSMIVKGYVSRYNGQTWVQALNIKYDT